VTPNAISVASVGFSLMAGAAMLATRWTRPAGDALLFVIAILGIQSRLLCNLFDGMVAVEGGKAGRAGEVFNDFPDRVADPILLACAGYAAGGPWGVGLGWAAACLALTTAYVRVLGCSLGTGIYFLGPMAKQHRMAMLTAACALAAGLTFIGRERMVLRWALAVIALGCLLTVVRRTRRIVADLEANA
jgi:phosphatidylglycerophosphate synthase